MRSLLSVVSLAALMWAGPGYAQQPAAARPCIARDQSQADYIQKLAHQYHPESLAPAAQHDSLIVGFVFDSTCQVLRHAVGRYGPDSSLTTDSLMARLFPGLRRSDFNSGGIIGIAMRTPGHPMIVWAVLKRS
jgi:hypothetical protein